MPAHRSESRNGLDVAISSKFKYLSYLKTYDDTVSWKDVKALLEWTK